MINLIVALLAIVLVAVLGLAAYFYGSDAMTGSDNRGNYAKAKAGATQIESAFRMYRLDNGGYPTGTSDQMLQSLVTGNYLRGVPPGSWQVSGEYLYMQIESLEKCVAFNKFANKGAVCPDCSSATSDYPACKM